MDSMTSSATAWSSQYNADLEDDDHCKAAECAESFIALLNAITGMYYVHQQVEVITATFLSLGILFT